MNFLNAVASLGVFMMPFSIGMTVYLDSKRPFHDHQVSPWVFPVGIISLLWLVFG